jgi:hypothetical protein
MFLWIVSLLVSLIDGVGVGMICFKTGTRHGIRSR